MINIDLILLVELLLAPQLRGPNFMAFINAALKPARTQLAEFYAFFSAVEYEITFNGQVINMEHVLNDQFDNILRRIEIVDTQQLNQRFLFNVAEDNEPVYVFNDSEGAPPNYLNNVSETITEYDFIVQVPIGLVYDATLMAYYINKYRIAPKRWIIQEV